MVLLAPPAEAKLIDNPQIVTYLSVEASREGSITLVGTGPGARASNLEIWHTIPQGAPPGGRRQVVEVKEVEGADGYRFDEDGFGNEVIVLYWNDPLVDRKIEYSMTFEVEVWSRDDMGMGRGFPMTLLTEPSQAITEKAYELAGGLTTIEKFMALTSYVYDLVEYDKTYQTTQKSADWVFRNRKAVCDGHANLLISMLRSLGYDAYYVIGYAYTEVDIDPMDPNYWGPHGWVEVEHLGMALSLDPTWLEHPVDATHIRFAVAPDSNYTEHVQIMANRVEVEWERGEYRIDLIDHKEEPRIGIDGRVVNERPGSEEHSLLVTDIRSVDGCVISELVFNSCTDSGKPFFGTLPENRHVGVCGNETLYWVLEAPRLQHGMEYVCGVSIQGSGARYNTTLTASEEGDLIRTMMSTTKVLTPGEFFGVNTTVENTGLFSDELELFMILGDSVQDHELSIEGLQAVSMTWTMKAPRKEGTYNLMFFDSRGGLLEEEITVIEKRSIEIAGVEIPRNMSVDELLYLNVTLRGLGDAAGEVMVSIGGFEQEHEFIIGSGEEKTFMFIYTPRSEGLKHVSIVVLSGEEEFQDGIVGNISVTRDVGWWERIVGIVRELLESLFRALGMSS